MSQSVALLGRQPAIGIAELESLYGDMVSPIGNHAALIDLPASDVDFKRLGGSVKLAKLLTVLDFTDWEKIETYLIDKLPEHVSALSDGKLTLGLSIYGLKVSPKRVNATGLSLKKVIRSTGRSVRIVPNKSPELSSATVLHNKLFTSHNWELIFIRDKNRVYLAQTSAVQDIDAYSARDQARPKRDAKVGMLPPKLAQIIINLATGRHSAESTKPVSVLDPFCGTGVVLQEALLMGYSAYGTDLEDRMIDYSNQNIEWLSEHNDFDGQAMLLETGDATNFEWQPFDAIACETYLGRPFSTLPKTEVLRQVMHDVDAIHKKFLQNVAKQTKPGFRLCLAVPAWRTKYGFTHLKVLDNLGDLGYTRAVFKHSAGGDMIYHREGQVVGRELVVLTRR